MIHQAAVSVEPLWQKEFKQSFSRPEDLLDFLQLPVTEFQKDIEARRLFPMRVPRPFAELMEKGNPTDPLFLQVMPLASEFEELPGFTSDPLLEQSNPTPGLLHKYKSRVLIIFRGGCAVNCRYCFRRHFPYADNTVNRRQLEQHVEYIQSHPDINEVILSGGDPLMANDQQLQTFLEMLVPLEQISRVRIHTRLPVVLPSRITPELLSLLSSQPFKTIMVLHINHANEISPELKEKATQLKQAGVLLLNQAVLLKRVNDTLQSQSALSETLFSADILPYYLHLLDKVSGASHFDIDEKEAKTLYQNMLAELPGFLVPKLVREIGGEQSKTPIPPY